MTRNRMRPIHPGEILREEFLVPLGMRAHALSQAIRVPATRMNDIVNEALWAQAGLDPFPRQ